MASLDELIAGAVEGVVNRIDAEAFCEAAGIRLGDLYNRMAVTIAKRFHVGTMSYVDADGAMNRIWHMMVDDAARCGDRFEFPEPAFSIYEAFDAGEYDHGDGDDPVEKYTKPRIAEIVRDA